MAAVKSSRADSSFLPSQRLIFIKAFESTGGLGLHGCVLSLKDGSSEQFVNWAGRLLFPSWCCTLVLTHSCVIHYFKSVLSQYSIMLDPYHPEVKIPIYWSAWLPDSSFMTVCLSVWLPAGLQSPQWFYILEDFFVQKQLLLFSFCSWALLWCLEADGGRKRKCRGQN